MSHRHRNTTTMATGQPIPNSSFTDGDVLFAHKQRLMAALGDQQSAYLHNLKLWFRQRWTKEDFDTAARKMLATRDNIALHNRFFVALLNKVDPMNRDADRQREAASAARNTESSAKPHAGDSSRRAHPQKMTFAKLSDRTTGDADMLKVLKTSIKRHRFQTTGPDRPRSFVATDLFRSVLLDEEAAAGDETPAKRTAGDESSAGYYRPPPTLAAEHVPLASAAAVPMQRFAAQELFLPDAGMITGRMLLAAWEAGLCSADDTIAELMVVAVQNLLKNIVQAVLMQRKHYRRTKGDGTTRGACFVYDIGAAFDDPQLRTSIAKAPVPVDDAPFDFVQAMPREVGITCQTRGPDVYRLSAYGGSRDARPPRHRSARIGLADLYRTLSDQGHLLPVHSVRAISVERIAQQLH